MLLFISVPLLNYLLLRLLQIIVTIASFYVISYIILKWQEWKNDFEMFNTTSYDNRTSWFMKWNLWNQSIGLTCVIHKLFWVSVIFMTILCVLVNSFATQDTFLIRKLFLLNDLGVQI